MKKEYIKPEIETIIFDLNQLMNLSDPALPGDGFVDWPEGWE